MRAKRRYIGHLVKQAIPSLRVGQQLRFWPSEILMAAILSAMSSESTRAL